MKVEVELVGVIVLKLLPVLLCSFIINTRFDMPLNGNILIDGFDDTYKMLYSETSLNQTPSGPDIMFSFDKVVWFKRGYYAPHKNYSCRVVCPSVPHLFSGHNFVVCGWIIILFGTNDPRVATSKVKVTGRP